MLRSSQAGAIDANGNPSSVLTVSVWPCGSVIFVGQPKEFSQRGGGEDQWVESFVVPELGKIKTDRPGDAMALVCNALDQEIDSAQYSRQHGGIPSGGVRVCTQCTPVERLAGVFQPCGLQFGPFGNIQRP